MKLPAKGMCHTVGSRGHARSSAAQNAKGANRTGDRKGFSWLLQRFHVLNAINRTMRDNDASLLFVRHADHTEHGWFLS